MLDAVCAKLASGKKVILVHSNADMDAIGSAYALARCFQADIFAPNGMDRLSKNVVANMTHRPARLVSLQETLGVVQQVISEGIAEA